MDDKIKIKNIFAIGWRCNTDEFLKDFLKERHYSSPFSYMVIDIKTALNFIDTKFLNYTNTNFIKPGNRTFKFNKANWKCKSIHKCSIIQDDYVDIHDVDKVCIWNHHHLSTNCEKRIRLKTIYSFRRRSNHLLKCLDEEPESTLLFYIEKIQTYEENKIFFDKSILDNYQCKFLILVPLLNFNEEPFLFYDDAKIKIIYFKSNLEGCATDIHYHEDQWKKLTTLIKEIYDFIVESR